MLALVTESTKPFLFRIFGFVSINRNSRNTERLKTPTFTVGVLRLRRIGTGISEASTGKRVSIFSFATREESARVPTLDRNSDKRRGTGTKPWRLGKSQTSHDCSLISAFES